MKKLFVSVVLIICFNISFCQCSVNGSPCDDGNPCTINDHCVNGVCVGTPKNCDDGNSCTTDFCDPVTGNCMHISNSASCDDGNYCTLFDYCVNGVCVGGVAVVCDDGNLCTTDVCNPVTGGCYHINTTGVCNDGNQCTINDQCVNGICIGTPVTGVIRTVSSKIDNTPNCLRDVIMQSCSNDIIQFLIDTSFVTSPIVLPHNINITGNGILSTIFDGGNSSTIFTIPSSISLSMSDLSFINGAAATNGGAFYNAGYIFMKNIVFKHNYEAGIKKAFSGTGDITILTAGSINIME